MSAEYSVEEVRERFEAWVQTTAGWKACKARNKPMHLRKNADGSYNDFRINDRWWAYQAAYAEAIKAGDGTMGRIDFKGMWNAMSDRVATSPPAQAAQVDALPDPLGCNDCTHPDCGRYNGPRSVECRAMLNNACARPAGNQSYRAPTAKPVAQVDEAESRLAAADTLLRDVSRYLDPRQYPNTIKRIDDGVAGCSEIHIRAPEQAE